MTDRYDLWLDGFWSGVLIGCFAFLFVWALSKVVILKKPLRKFKVALLYWYPRRLTLKCNPRVHAWLWWNF